MSKNFSRRKKLTILLIVCVMVVFCAFFVTTYLSTNGFEGKYKEDKQVQIEITEGMNGSEIANLLEEKGVVVNAIAFRLGYKLSDKKADFQVGKYTLSPKMTYDEIIEILTRYSTEGMIKITIPEGCKLSQVAAIYGESGLFTAEEFIKETENGDFDYEFIKDIPKGENRLEGFLFPQTYLFKPDTTAHDAVDAMLKEFSKIYTPELTAQAKTHGMTFRELITLASIIEKEGAYDLDKISSVFHNRLKDGHTLESCATVNYLFDVPKDVLSYDDTYIDSPYNTYLNKGLPPTPICSPGADAVKAAAYPADTDYYFFRADGKGGNIFSETQAEHNAKGNE